VNLFPTYKAARVHRSTGDAATWPIAVHVSRESTWMTEPRLRARGSAWQHDDRGVLPQDLNGQPANCFLRLSHQPRSTSDQLRKRPRVPMLEGPPGARSFPHVPGAWRRARQSALSGLGAVQHLRRVATFLGVFRLGAGRLFHLVRGFGCSSGGNRSGNGQRVTDRRRTIIGFPLASPRLRRFRLDRPVVARFGVVLVDALQALLQVQRSAEPGPRHLQKNVAFLLGPSGTRPANTIVRILPTFFGRRHDTGCRTAATR
jgi:hypothetical protein